ncbi:hypothetical protein H0H87_004974 [Tephrocybe sp. NHM501043]|nr:hypothetical protein H0H87_004974 [Tephrocybe sp. NHM501043]
MGWFSSLFSSGETLPYNRRGQALSSTHEAFSLPTSSPTLHQHPDAFNPDTLQTPDIDASMSPAYTYPPQGPSAYGYVPTSASLSSRPASATLLPTHLDPNHTPLSPRQPYPPLESTWNRIRIWLNREYPELGDTLNYGILPLDLAQLEMQFGFALPPAIRESYLCVDGQEAESAAGCSEGLFFGLKLLPLEDVLQEWRFWREVDNDPETGANLHLREAMESIPPGWIRKEYSQRGWIPLIADKVGNYVGVDLNPDESGAVGQVIVFGRDFDTKVVLWRGDGPGGWAKWLASFVEELESGEGIEIGNGGEGSDESEDDLGYESYFYDGTGRGQGDGGGDTGNSGLRLTGEYRGWNVLEAWADRSLRRWHEAGVISDSVLLPPQEDNKASIRPYNSAEPQVHDITHESSTEVGIPILADVEETIPAPTVAPSLDRRTNSAPLPTISVTRPPAPRPVELPQPLDILPDSDSPRGSPPSSFDSDLEAGRSAGMSEVSIFPPSPRRANTNSDASASGSVTRPRPASPSNTAGPSTSPKTDIPDLLADSAPVLNTKPIAPLSSAKANVADVAAIPMQELSLDDTKPVVTKEDEKVVEEEADPNTTIRLVGGGGVAGTVKVEEEEEAVEDAEGVASDTVSISSTASEVTAKGGKTHKKTKSGLAGLKKLALGRKRDSASSVKGAET